MIREYFGVGSIENVRLILAGVAPRSIFLVTGKRSYDDCGASKALGNLLAEYSVSRFNDFDVNPNIDNIRKGVDLFKKKRCDLVIAVGGGSVMDTAKVVNILSAHDEDAALYVKKERKIRCSGKPLVAVPTTAGSGGEATHFAALYIDKKKYSLEDERLLPTYAIIDPQFTFSLPKRITASTGMDALSQAIESYWSIYSSDESKAYAREAIMLAREHIVHAVNQPTIEARIAMSRAAHAAGKAINTTRTTACHAVSYPITAYFGVPHGHAVGLTLSRMFAYNSTPSEADILDIRGVAYVKGVMRELAVLLGAQDTESAKKAIDSIMRKIGLEMHLRELGISGNDIEIIIKNGFDPERVKNNPRLVTEQALRKILNDIR